MESNGITISPVDMKARAALDLRAGDTARVTLKITEKVKEKDKVKEKTR